MWTNLNRNQKRTMKKTQVFGLIRHILTAGGVYLVGKGAIEEGIYAELMGASLTLIGLVWSHIEKK